MVEKMSSNQLMTGLFNISFVCRENIANLIIHFEITICQSKSVKDQKILRKYGLKTYLGIILKQLMNTTPNFEFFDTSLSLFCKSKLKDVSIIFIKSI